MSEIDSFNIEEFSFKPPVYDEDCDMIEICESIGATYNICYKGCEMIGCKRCSIDTKQRILQQHRAEELAKQNNNEDRKLQFSHDWKIAFFSTIGGVVGGFIASILFWILTK